MGPYRELFVDAEDAIERERAISQAADRWVAIIRDLYPELRAALDYKVLPIFQVTPQHMDIEMRIAGLERRLGQLKATWPMGLFLGLSDL